MLLAGMVVDVRGSDFGDSAACLHCMIGDMYAGMYAGMSLQSSCANIADVDGNPVAIPTFTCRW